ncbi:MAG: cell wall hydrolase [Mycoplasmatota bacterium]|nr:cell wall hydrolase [Mycoplasmatota bacterium]
MMIVKYNDKELELLARLMRAEALGEGNLGMLMVGNVGINRVLASCLTFKDINSIYRMIYQSPGGFSGTSSSLFFGNPTEKEKLLAKRVLRGEYYFPATNALWFYAPALGTTCANTWWEQQFAGRYKNHCFYRPDSGVCREIH